MFVEYVWYVDEVVLCIDVLVYVVLVYVGVDYCDVLFGVCCVGGEGCYCCIDVVCDDWCVGW